MRYTATHKDETRQRILDKAAELFRQKGYDGVGIERIMATARLTRGGFYAHFKSKAALFAEVLRRESDFVRRVRSARDARTVIRGYLDPANREAVGRGCILASLTNEVPRRDRAAKRAYADQVEALTAELVAHVSASPAEARARALEAVALCVGGISLARGVADDDLAEEILGVCRERACEAIEASRAE